MHAVIRWFRTPLPLKFWLYAGLATPFLLIGLLALEWAVQVELSGNAPPLSHGLRQGVWIVFCFAVGGILVWRAVRSYPRRS